MVLTGDSRHALSRARLFLEKAQTCSGEARVDFEAFLEAAIRLRACRDASPEEQA